MPDPILPAQTPATLQPLLTAPQREIPSLLQLLQVGQILPAKVLAQIQPGLIRLQIATTELLARTPVRLEPGTPLRLEVMARLPTPELRIVREPAPAAHRDRVVRTAVARQLPGAEVREAAQKLASDPDAPRLESRLQRFQNILKSAGLGPERPDARQVQRAIATSGVFHEAPLRTGAPPSIDDQKRQLLLLLASVTGELRQRQAPPPGDADPQAQHRDTPHAPDTLLHRLARLVEGSVARIQLQQSTALPVDDNARQAWQFDLPFRHPEGTDDVMLRIERRDRNPSEGDPEWAVNLAFEFDTIGTLQCRIALTGDRVATTFWCERETTLDNVERGLPSLRAALEAQGLEVVHLHGIQGRPAEPMIHVPVPASLLDERA
ncbi:MAG: flagellar hook-length control protein FliK [Gammaproteobacteria bacterium]|nr:flagellar hook-length control protein FliK [Gammaproteobacteria bacterium]